MAAKSSTGLVYEELYYWHDEGCRSYGNSDIQPMEGWGNAETKRRLQNLLDVSGLLEHLHRVRARPAEADEIGRYHTQRYIDFVQAESLKSKGGDAGEAAQFGCGGYRIAALSAGGVLSALEAVMDEASAIRNAYCLVRPPGHHAVADKGMGFCVFNNVVLAALHAREKLGIQLVAIVDYDVHHGNGTQEAFYGDPETLFIDLHQDNCYPQEGSGSIDQTGDAGAEGSTINLALPPGSGEGAYLYALEKVVLPALKRFKPDLILVSSGFDASFADPQSAMMLHSEVYRQISTQLLGAAEDHCAGRIIFIHEGGYSKDYVPFCGLAVVEALSGVRTSVNDPYLEEAQSLGYQGLQPHQEAVVQQVCELHNLSTTQVKLSPAEKQVAQQIAALLDGQSKATKAKLFTYLSQ
jgi:acetoin utilization deacetylase AcuC-like enzyme